MAVGILLVGGFGTRLKPLTNESPKPMLPVAGLPVTEHQILAAKKAGIHTLVLATSYLAEVFTPYFGDGTQWDMKILYAVEKEPLGTGGAIRNAAQLLERDEEIVIFNGDVLSRHSIADQLAFHQQHKADVDGADHLAGERVEGGHQDLIGRKGDRNPEHRAPD